uniref:Plexin_cytopl domain-containing protein n=1 Tax=Macrostomum lignano TaxID=282301 RepID=A0A1I8FUX2_9PLAT
KLLYRLLAPSQICIISEIQRLQYLSLPTAWRQRSHPELVLRIHKPNSNTCCNLAGASSDVGSWKQHRGMAWPLSQLLQGLLLLQQLFCAAHGQYLPTQTVSYLRDLTRYLSPRESLVGLNSSQTQLRYYMLERDMDAFNNSLVWRVSADARITAPLAEIAQPRTRCRRRRRRRRASLPTQPLTPSLSLPDDLLLSVIIRPSKFSGTLLAIRDPSGEVIQFGLAFTLRPF